MNVVTKTCFQCTGYSQSCLIIHFCLYSASNSATSVILGSSQVFLGHMPRLELAHRLLQLQLQLRNGFQRFLWTFCSTSFFLTFLSIFYLLQLVLQTWEATMIKKKLPLIFYSKGHENRDFIMQWAISQVKYDNIL